MKYTKNELIFAKAFIEENYNRLVDWSIGDIKKCCRLKEDGSCEDNGALVAAFILWCCAIEYFGGLFTGISSKGGTKSRITGFVKNYMPKYDAEKIVDLRWNLTHYYTVMHFVLYHENNIKLNNGIHLTNSEKGVKLHLGCSVFDLENAVERYTNDLEKDNSLKIKMWRYYKEQKPLMPLKFEKDFFTISKSDFSSGMTASGTTSEYFPKINKPF